MTAIGDLCARLIAAALDWLLWLCGDRCACGDCYPRYVDHDPVGDSDVTERS